MTRLSGIDPALAEFCAPWLMREPQLTLACQFAAPGRARAQFVAAQVLMRELCEASVGVSDPSVSHAKIGWWFEEAALWRTGHSRHPLVHGFECAAAAEPLAELAGSVLIWLDAPSAAAIADCSRGIDPIAQRLAQLHGDNGDAALWRTLWFASALRLTSGAEGLATVMPLDLLARHGRRRSDWIRAEGPVRRALIGDLAAQIPRPSMPASAPALRALGAVEQRWLARLAKGSDLTALRVNVGDTFAAWRAARA